MNPDWTTDAACRGMDPNRFVPLPGATHIVREAIAVCRTCTVIEACAAHAKRHRINDGIWGGVLLGYPSRSGIDTRRINRRLAAGAVS